MKLLHVKHSGCWNKKLRFGSVRHLYQNLIVSQGKIASFEVTLKIVSQKMKKIDLIQVSVIFVHWM